MPLALVSDIHGNDSALAAVVAELERLGIERAVCLGDVALGGTQPAEVLDRLEALGWPVILGDADAFLLEPPAGSPELLREAQLERRAWTLAQLSRAQLERIRSFVPTLDVEVDGLTLRAFHGSPSSYADVVLPETPDAQAERMLGGSGVDLLAGGHTRLQWARYVDGALYVNPGSVGLAHDRFDVAPEPAAFAEYALVTGGSGATSSRVVGRVLTLRELNRATLARQLLLDRKKLGVLPAIERLAGLQAQWPQAPYVGLWSRLAGFAREELERALRAGEVVKPTVMRGTLHLLTARDYPLFWTALRDMSTWYDETHLAHAQRAMQSLRELAAGAPISHDAALAHLEERYGHHGLEARRIFRALRRHAHLLHTPDSALWASRPTGVFVSHPEPEERLEVLAARRELVRRYLAAFGPATRADIADWSGLRVGDFAPAVDALEPLRRFRDENGRELLDLPRAPLPRADTPAPVRFLPKWDSLLLAHADRRRVLPEELRKRVIGKNGDVAQTVLVDGVVAATWTADKKGAVTVAPLEPLTRAARAEVDAEAARLEAWLR